MKNIEIATAHNIAITYPLASTGHRILSTAIDLCIIGAYLLIVGIVAGSNSTLWMLLGIPVVSFYHVLFEVFRRGQSPGKQLVKLRVVSINGTTPSINDYLLRWIFRLLDITFSMGSLAIIFVSSSAKNQRIGDILAQTSVVRLESDHVVNLEAIQNIGANNSQLEYPGLTRYDDTDMLLVKNALHRYKSNPNPANLAIINRIYERIKGDLDLELNDRDRLSFLQHVLKEYIIITR